MGEDTASKIMDTVQARAAQRRRYCTCIAGGVLAGVYLQGCTCGGAHGPTQVGRTHARPAHLSLHPPPHRPTRQALNVLLDVESPWTWVMEDPSGLSELKPDDKVVSTPL